jgi:hypothetical protein
MSENITENIARGISFLSTPSHGYVVLSAGRMAEMPAVLLTPSTFYNAGSNHFEEDCEWARVALSYPQYFSKSQEQADAERTMAHFQPDMFAEWIAQGRPLAIEA